MPRPLINPDGTVVPESEVRLLYVVWYSHPGGSTFKVGYLTQYGGFDIRRESAAAWTRKEDADACAAALIMTDPGEYFGNVEVKEIRG
jgi:hypothetical protein